jgi:hypothetical protein
MKHLHHPTMTPVTRLACALAMLALLVSVLPVSAALAGPTVQAVKGNTTLAASNQSIPYGLSAGSRLIDSTNEVDIWLLALSTFVLVCVVSFWLLLFHIFTAGAPPNH